MCVHGAIGCQYQLPNDVPQISSSPTMMKIAANTGHRGDRSMNQAKYGSQSAPWNGVKPLWLGCLLVRWTG